MQKQRTVNLSAVPSCIPWIIKNHILNSSLCLTSGKILTGLNTVGSQNIKPILIGTHKNLSHDPLTPTSACAHIICGQESAKYFSVCCCRSSNSFCTYSVAAWPNTCLFQHRDVAVQPSPCSGGGYQIHTRPGDAGQLWLGEILKCLEGPTHSSKAIAFSSAFLMNGIKISTGQFLAAFSKSSTPSGQSLTSVSAMAFQPGNCCSQPSPGLWQKDCLTLDSPISRHTLFENVHTEDTPKSHILRSLTQRYSFIQLFWYSANS